MKVEDWPMRPLLYACLFACVGVLVYLLLGESFSMSESPPDWRIAGAGGLVVASTVFVLCAQRRRLMGAAIFSLLLGTFVAAVISWHLSIGWAVAWNFVALAIFLLVIIPFFQSWKVSRLLDYSELHSHAWTNVVVVMLAAAFTAISFGMAFLLSALLQLVGLDVLDLLLHEPVFNCLLAGAAFGGAMGVLREYLGIYSAAQGGLQSVLSLLAVPLALGLIIFLGGLPFTGLASLWQATNHTSAIVFVCAASSVLLINAVLGDSDEGSRASWLVQYASRALAFCIAPLSVIAIVSLNLRVQQYGWTPDRIWAALICTLLLFYGLFYCLAAFSRGQWQIKIRRYNIALAGVVAIIAFYMATPLLDVGAVSARDQITRFNSGDTSVQNFDAASLAFKFGPSGRKALEALNTSGRPVLTEKVHRILNSQDYWSAQQQQNSTHSAAKLQQKLQLHPSDTLLDEGLRTLLTSGDICESAYCHLILQGDGFALSVSQHCWGDTENCRPKVREYERCYGQWQQVFGPRCGDLPSVLGLPDSDESTAQSDIVARQNAAALAGDIEIREVTRRQIYLGGEAVGDSFK